MNPLAYVLYVSKRSICYSPLYILRFYRQLILHMFVLIDGDKTSYKQSKGKSKKTY